MDHRTFKKIAVACAAMAVIGHAQCKSTTLYSGSEGNGFMEETTRTFPEAPEWKANWGNFPNMQPPYIRLSGQKNVMGDWSGALVFPQEAPAQGGTVHLDVRATQNVKFGLWLDSGLGGGKRFTRDLKANETASLDIPVNEIALGGAFSLKKLWIGLLGVPAYQYTTLFIDNVSVKCPAGAVSSESGDEDAPYVFLGGDASSPQRQSLWVGESVPEASARYTEAERSGLQEKAQHPFVLSDQEHDRILRFLQSDSLTPEQSREGWDKIMYLVDRNRLGDSVIANPRELYFDAGSVAAMHEMRAFPLLVANVDYNYTVCTDSLCKSTELDAYHLLAAGFPTSYVRGSKIRIAYDPFFVATTRRGLPEIDVCLAGKCKRIEPNSETEIEFPSAGIQKIVMNLHDGATTIQQTLSLEVK